MSESPWRDLTQEETDSMIEGLKALKHDPVHRPAHYTSFGAEVIDITEWLSFNLGNVVKYVARAGIKTQDPREDLDKALWYLKREIARLSP